MKETDDRFRECLEIVNNAHSVILKIKPDATITFINEFGLGFFGYEPEEIVGRKIIGTLVPETETTGRDLRRMIEDLGIHPEHYTRNQNENRRKDGQRVWIAWTNHAVQDGDGRIEEIICVGNDITDYHRAVEERLRLAAALDAAGEGIALVSLSGTIEHVNDAFARITGYSSHDLVGKPVDVLNHGEDGLSRKTLAAARHLDRPEPARMRGARRDGTFYDIDVTIAPVRDDGGRITAFVVVFCDVTEQIALEEQFRQVRKWEAIGRLSGGLAHQHNNVLSVIVGYTELAIDDTGDSVATDNMKRALDGAFEARGVVRRLMSFTGEKLECVKPLRIAPVIEESVSILRIATANRVSIMTDMQAGEAIVLADPWSIRQIVTDVGTASIKRMHGSRGTFSVTLDECTIERERQFTGLTVQPGRYVRLTLTDTGPAIRQSDRERIFDPFFTGSGPDGMPAMGLAFVYAAVRSLKGGLTVSSPGNGGTQFDIYLPAVGKTARTQEAESGQTLTLR